MPSLERRLKENAKILSGKGKQKFDMYFSTSLVDIKNEYFPLLCLKQTKINKI